MSELKKLVCLKIGPKEGSYSIREATSKYRTLAREVKFDGLELRFNAVPYGIAGGRGPPVKEMEQFVSQVRRDFGKDGVLYLHASNYLNANLDSGRLGRDFLDCFDKLIIHKGAYEDILESQSHHQLSEYESTKLAGRKVWPAWVNVLAYDFDEKIYSIETLMENQPYFDTNLHMIHKEASRRRLNKTFDTGHFMRCFNEPAAIDQNARCDDVRAYMSFDGGKTLLNLKYIKEIAANISHCHVHGLILPRQDHVPFVKETIPQEYEGLIVTILANSKRLESFTVELDSHYLEHSNIGKSIEYFEDLLRRQP